MTHFTDNRYLSVLVACLVSFSTYLFAQDIPNNPSNDQYDFITVDIPSHRFTDRWALVIDTSSSGQRVFSKVLFAYDRVMEFVNDDFLVTYFSFNSSTYFREWEAATPLAVHDAKAWLNSTKGVLSRGTNALTEALRLQEPHLTIVIIGDGGFTEACSGRGFERLAATIQNGQQWRLDNALYPALICTVGIENIGYTAGGKPSDADCQGFMQRIGTTYGGGYFLVR